MFGCILLKRISFMSRVPINDLYNTSSMNVNEKLLPIVNDKWVCYWWGYRPSTCFLYHAARCAHRKDFMYYAMDLFCPLKMDEETNDVYQERLEWMSGRCAEDIYKWVRGGVRSRYSVRC